MSRPLIRFLTAAAAVGIGSCVPVGPECQSDGDCGTDICANDRMCLPADQVVRVELHWTIAGAPVAPGADAACTAARITDLSVDFRDSDRSGGVSSDEELGFRPVPCDLGRITYDRLPEWYDLLVLTAYDADGEVASVEAPILDRNSILEVDLRP